MQRFVVALEIDRMTRVLKGVPRYHNTEFAHSAMIIVDHIKAELDNQDT